TISIKAEEIFNLFGFSITNAFIVLIIVLILLGIMAFILKKRIDLKPNGFQNIIEIGIEKLLGIMESILGSKKKAEKYLPLVATIFVFILFCNWVGLVPGVGSIGYRHGEELVPYLRAPSSDLNFTLALALISVILINAYSFLELGFLGHIKKYFNFKGPIEFFVGVLEIISEFAKIISFSFRLFGNIFAGEILLLIIAFLLPFVGSIPFVILEIFVGFIQAFVFSMLTTVFLAVNLQHGEQHAKY
ncbi:MAG: F0F1 ATP synthase subunit A, partial [Patescibacteria group bacterium]